MTKVSFELAGLTLLEPMAFLLNWVLMIQAWIYYTRLKKWRVSTFSINWRWFFLLFGFSGLFGGLSHLLFHYTGLPGKGPGWVTAIFTVTFMEMAMVSLTTGRTRAWLQGLVSLKMFGAFVALTLNYSFSVVIVHSIGMAFFLLTPSIRLMVSGRFELNFFFLGALCLIATLPFKLMAIDLHLWFNRDDMGHILMAMASYCFYRGVKVREESIMPQLALSQKEST